MLIERSNSIKELAQALSIFQGKIGNVGKDAVNPFFKSKYASFEKIITTIKPVLTECGLAYSQFPHGDNGLVTMIMHSSGESITSLAKFYPKDNSPQALGSAITYMRRYALSAALGLATENDDDGNEATHKVSDSAQNDSPGIDKKEFDAIYDNYAFGNHEVNPDMYIKMSPEQKEDIQKVKRSIKRVAYKINKEQGEQLKHLREIE